MSECRDRAKQALASATEKTDSHIKMRLSAGLAAALFYTQKGAVPEVAGLWSEVIAIADHLKDTEYRLWGRWGLWNHQLNHGLFRAALQTAQTFRDLAAESADLASGDRMVGVSLHYLGQQTRAREHLEYVLKRDVGVAGNSIGRIQYDPKLAARAYLPRVLWLQGFPEQAMEAAEKAISDAHESGHVLTSALVLVQAGCPIALLTGELERAESYVVALLEIATKHNLSFWRAEAQCHEGILQVRRGDITTGLRVFRIAANELIDLHTTMNLASYHTAMAAALVETMMVTEFQEVLAAALARAEQDEDYWCMPEIIRLRGEFFLKIGSLDEAEGQFQQALNLATRQETLSWALRAAMSLARVMRDQNRPTEARGTLLPIYQKFDEGFATEDLLQAKSLLESLG
jgi:predicted ATPase